MTWWEAIVLGLVQGLTEFLPISSSAHLRIVGELLPSADPGAAFTAITQIGTETAVVIYFQRLMSHDSLSALATEMRYADVSALYAAIGENHISATNVVQKLVQSMGGESGAEETLAEATMPGEHRPRAGGETPASSSRGCPSTDIWVKLARCCTPVPGDPIVGFITRGSGVSVQSCRLRQPRGPAVAAGWAKSSSVVQLAASEVSFTPGLSRTMTMHRGWSGVPCAA
ncbi:undecaprenyl-diphosphate phosphatase [Georgenia sp. SUBG003]|uniref:undecaprenyl-diphosphate phosphatase n=1 Tax=Georgenia sp. SUBG003 TaxID=1497974 RepID=UPI003AB450E4